jgi:hypothetical protein
MVHWSVEPLIPAALWLALAAASAALLGWYAWRRPRTVSPPRWMAIVGFMAISLALVLGLLLNPIRVREIPPPAGKPLLTLLVDATASMNTPDAGGRPRYVAAVEAAENYVDSLSDRFDVRVRAFADTMAASDARSLASRKPVGQSTDLSAALDGALDDYRPQGQAIALLSDGAHNANEVSTVLDAARRARTMAAPVFTRTFGGQTGGYDLGIELRSPQDLTFIGQRVLITARITHVGLVGARPNVMLFQDGNEIARQRADLPTDAPGSAEFWVDRPKSGVYPYEVRVESLPGEMTLANNSASYLLRVVDEPIRVLQVEGKPYWDSKFLLRTLASAPAVELDSAVRISDGRIMWRTIRREDSAAATQAATTQPAEGGTTAPPAPQRVESWKIVNDPAAVLGDPKVLERYQILVIGRDAEAFLTDAAITNLQNWVAHSGGSLVCYRGSPTALANERLSKLLPVRWTASPESRFHVKMTEQGRDLHWLGNEPGVFGDVDSLPRLPSLATTSLPERSKPLAVVLARSIAAGGDGSPVVVYQPYGNGRVVVIEGAGMWRWAFLSPQYQNQEDTYRSLWQSLMRWLVSGTGLMPGQDLMLRADKLSFSTSESAGVSLLAREEAMRGGPPPVSLTDADGHVRQFVAAAVSDDPQAFHIDFGKLPEGHYLVRIAAGEAMQGNPFGRTAFDVRRFGQEELDIKARPDLMARIAHESGGAVLVGSSADDLARQFSEHLARARPPRSQRTTAWDRWWVLAGVIGVWGMSWWMRRSAGLT